MSEACTLPMSKWQPHRDYISTGYNKRHRTTIADIQNSRITLYLQRPDLILSEKARRLPFRKPDSSWLDRAKREVDLVKQYESLLTAEPDRGSKHVGGRRQVLLHPQSPAVMSDAEREYFERRASFERMAAEDPTYQFLPSSPSNASSARSPRVEWLLETSDAALPRGPPPNPAYVPLPKSPWEVPLPQSPEQAHSQLNPRQVPLPDTPRDMKSLETPRLVPLPSSPQDVPLPQTPQGAPPSSSLQPSPRTRSPLSPSTDTLQAPRTAPLVRSPLGVGDPVTPGSSKNRTEMPESESSDSQEKDEEDKGREVVNEIEQPVPGAEMMMLGPQGGDRRPSLLKRALMNQMMQNPWRSASARVPFGEEDNDDEDEEL